MPEASAPSVLADLLALLSPRDRRVYAALLGALVTLVLLPFALTAGARSLAPRLEPPPPPVDVEPPPPKPAPGRFATAVRWVADNDRDVEGAAQASFAALVLLAAAYEGGKRAHGWLATPRRELSVELPLVLVAALVPASLVAAVAIGAAFALGLLAKDAAPAQVLVVPLPLAIAATCYAGVAGFILFLRAGRPTVDEAVAPPEQPDTPGGAG